MDNSVQRGKVPEAADLAGLEKEAVFRPRSTADFPHHKA